MIWLLVALWARAALEIHSQHGESGTAFRYTVGWSALLAALYPLTIVCWIVWLTQGWKPWDLRPRSWTRQESSRWE